MLYDLIIIGGGPAGVAAGVYALRKRLPTLFITDVFGGQSTVSEDIQNWIGTPSISGVKLAEDLEKHLRTYSGDIVTIQTSEKVTRVEKVGELDTLHFKITTTKGVYEARTVLACAGSYRRKLTIPGADQFEHKGITYCASCDGPLFTGQDVVVIGGGNAGFESAAQLLAYCKSVTLIQRGKEFRADPVTVAKILANPKMKAITDTELVEIKGDTFTKSIIYKNNATGENIELPTTGIFVEIGLLPTTDFLKGLVTLDKNSHIVIDPRTQQTSTRGVWAAGDSTDVLYHQNNIAVGDAVRALEDIYIHLHTK
jgi:alkyl hydroperoxide reductase subunit F